MRLIILLLWCSVSFGQTIDTIAITGIASRNSMQFETGSHTLTADNPMILGVGFAKNHSGLNLELNVAIKGLATEGHGQTSAFDVHLRRIQQRFLLDVFLQNYKGFYDEKTLNLYPDMRVVHAGAEATYLLNKRVSGRAAFGLFKKQEVSAGSIVVGGGVHFFRFFDSEPLFAKQDKVKNIQTGLSGGYAYSWVINEKFLWSNLVTVGMALGTGSTKPYISPTVLARSSFIYHKKDWEAALSWLIHTKQIQEERVDMTFVYLRLHYTRYINWTRK